MKFNLIIDKAAEESVTVTVHAHSPLTDEIESLVLAYGGDDRLVGYRGEEMKLRTARPISCACGSARLRRVCRMHL